MPSLQDLLALILHADRFLLPLASTNDGLVYVCLFAVVFAETGLIVTPFLPGDSLLFAAGALAAAGALDWAALFALLTVAAIAGDAINYSAGRMLSARVLETGRLRWVKTEHLDRARRFYAERGASAIVVARFAPILRTFAPFVAGVAFMHPARFAVYNVAGALAWVTVCVGAGYLWGETPFVKRHFSAVMLGVVVVSLAPLAISWLASRGKQAREEAP